MNEKFTQGKWFVEDFNAVNTADKNICRCIRMGMKTEETRANAYLIAVAPEMYRNNEQTLTELEQMIPAMLAVCADCTLKKCKVCRFAEVLKTASAMERRIETVQKKARGEK